MGFDSLIWRLKMWFRKLLPIAIISALVYGGYNMYRDGAFRHGVGPAVNYMIRHIPFFGSKFSKKRSSVAAGRYHKKGGRHHRTHRRHRR